MQAIFWVLIKRPNVIITTGAGVVVPTIFLQKDTKIQSDLYQLGRRCNARFQNPYMDRKICRFISRSMGRNENNIS